MKSKVPDATIASLGNTYFSWVNAHEDAATAFRHALHELMRDAAAVSYTHLTLPTKA